MLCHRERSPLRSRPRRCAISSPTLVLVEARPLRRFSSIASRHLLHAIDGDGRSLSIVDAIDPPFVCLFGNQIETELLADDASKKAANRVPLPFRRGHNGSNRCASGRPFAAASIPVDTVSGVAAPWVIPWRATAGRNSPANFALS